jgi:hypothetical protein
MEGTLRIAVDTVGEPTDGSECNLTQYVIELSCPTEQSHSLKIGP